MARPVFGFACVALLLCAVKVMCPSFVSAPRPMTPSIHQSTAVASKEALQLLQPEMAKQVTPAAVKSAALSAAFALMAEPAFAAEPGSYDVREDQARIFMVTFSIGSFLVAAGVVFIISKLYE
ncbi:Uncharacterized protein SCF082_LOCUS35063 [Durusdinium trenchii]|uniref:Transmembrane protein n=1 Tax=Durusdinium trenchii TaxID=1381693 RepID=A0ABP0P3Z9_9DINO